MRKDWVLEIRTMCEASAVPFFFKQWGGVNRKKTGRVLDGKLYSQMPRRKGFGVKRIWGHKRIWGQTFILDLLSSRRRVSR